MFTSVILRKTAFILKFWLIFLVFSCFSLVWGIQLKFYIRKNENPGDLGVDREHLV